MKLQVRFLLTFLLLSASQLGAQCVMCRTAAESESKTQGLNSGILYLMAAPYVIMAAAACYWFFIYRKKKKQKQQHISN